MKVVTSVRLAKIAAKLSRISGRGSGQALPGVVAERLDPGLAGKLARQLPHGTILVTGTNGKTTTTKMIAAMLAADGEKVLTNSTGSNLKRGVTSALIAAADWRGRLGNFTVGLFEVDEASLRQVAPDLQPAAIVVLNLFRDQLDRYGELDTTAAIIGEGIAATQAHLYLNADDPLVASLSRYASNAEHVSYFGIEGLPVSDAPVQAAIDSDRCPICHDRLEFSRVFYGHIGHYRCLRGHFFRPQPRTAVTSVESATDEGSRFTVTMGGKRSQVMLPLPGTYNLYNALAALSLAYGLKLDLAQSVEILATIKPAFGRVEQIRIEGRTLYLLLIKNPAGFTQVLQTFLLNQSGPQVLMAVNDMAADGRDVSWLWDVPLEAMSRVQPHVITSGIRASDMSLRLHYAGIDSEMILNFEAALKRLISNTPVGGTAYILPTYTAMLELRKLLSKLTQIPEIGE